MNFTLLSKELALLLGVAASFATFALDGTILPKQVHFLSGIAPVMALLALAYSRLIVGREARSASPAIASAAAALLFILACHAVLIVEAEDAGDASPTPYLIGWSLTDVGERAADRLAAARSGADAQAYTRVTHRELILEGGADRIRDYFGWTERLTVVAYSVFYLLLIGSVLISVDRMVVSGGSWRQARRSRSPEP